MTYKVAVIGDKDSILPFKMIGFDIFPVREALEARVKIKALEDTHGIIFITEQIAQEIPDTVEHYRTKTRPALILIPNYRGSLNMGIDNIRENMVKAIGQDIL